MILESRERRKASRIPRSKLVVGTVGGLEQQMDDLGLELERAVSFLLNTF